MNWQVFDTWTVVVAGLCAAACALPGALLVLRRMSMMGDAISHAVLPGLAVAFLITQSRDPLTMLAGAVVVGILTALLIQWIQALGQTDPGASMGVVFTVLFAIGVILMRRALDNVHIDADCVLYGAIELVYLDDVNFLGWRVPRAAVVTGSMFLINLLLIILFYKEFLISAFDPGLATTVGINSSFMHYLLMAMVAATAVASFESVGSIVVIAMLIVPGAAAYLLTDRLSVLLLFSVAIGVLSAVLGHLSAITVPKWFGFDDTSTSGMMAVMAGLLFASAALAGPRHGIISKVLHRLRLSVRIAQEDLLSLLYRVEELSGQRKLAAGSIDPLEFLRLGRLRRTLTYRGLKRRGLIESKFGALGLTDAGRDEARDLVRTHRLWESYLARYLQMRPDHFHLSAERLEHATDAQLQRDLAEKIGSPDTDPQGKQIPQGKQSEESS